MKKETSYRLRCSARWKARLAAYAEEQEMDMADVIRQAVTEKITSQGPTMTPHLAPHGFGTPGHQFAHSV